MKKSLLLLAFLLPAFAFSQQVNTLTGTISEEVTTEPLANVAIDLVRPDSSYVSTKTNEDGSFTVDLSEGDYAIRFEYNGYKYMLGPYKVDQRLVSLGGIPYTSKQADEFRMNQENIPTISGETDLKDEGGQNVSSALNASRDPFLATASFIFSNARFKIRGYENENFTTFMNGIPVNDLEDGGTVWNQWGGLNNVMYNRENSVGLQPTTFTFGGVGGAYALDSRASKQRKQLQVSYAAANRNYRHRLMATYSTGMLKKGWAVTLSASRRWAEEGYVAGTFYDAYAYFVSVDKHFGSNHSLSLTIFGAPIRNGRSQAAVQEMYDLAGSHYYNPNWGYFNGKKRNANVGNVHQPTFILTKDWKINNKSSMMTSAGFMFGKRSVTALDWNNAPDPRPDYYRYLPSYYSEDPTLQAIVEKELRDNVNARQINWDNLYEANAMSWETIDSVNGIAGNSVTGKRARYIIENRIQDTKRFNIANVYNNNVSDHVSVTAGLNYQFQITRNYKEVQDLLGADFYVDVNQFAVRDFPDSFSVAQNDLNRPNRTLKEGDQFGYDYYSYVHKVGAWGQGVFKFNKVDFFVAADLSFTTFWREGKTQVGLFPNNSFGPSERKKFFNYAFKGGVTYKVDGRNYLFANGSYLTRAPYFDNSFVSPRTRNEIANGLKSEEIYSFEVGYNLRTPRVKLKADMYFTQFNNQTKTMSFFHDDLRTLVNYTLTNIDTRHWGGELGAEIKLYKGFSANIVGAMGRYTYTSRPDATITQDNNQTVVNNETVYAQGFNVAGTPQLAYSFGLNYRDPKFWFINVNFNYYDWMWLDFNPARRTEAGIELVDPNSELFDKITRQQRLKGQFTMDIFAGYSWLLNNQFKGMKHRNYLVFNVGVNNVTNNKNLVTGGYEQLRFDFTDNNPDKFPAKYFYGYGTTFFISAIYRFQ